MSYVYQLLAYWAFSAEIQPLIDTNCMELVVAARYPLLGPGRVEMLLAYAAAIDVKEVLPRLLDVFGAQFYDLGELVEQVFVVHVEYDRALQRRLLEYFLDLWLLLIL